MQRLGRVGVDITRLGIGTWAMGAGKGGSSHLGSADDAQSIATIRRGLELGMNWIDTAAYYGFGHAERIVAEALRELPNRPFVFTKCGLVPAERGEEHHEFRLKAWSIRAEVEASQQRLEMEQLDMVMLHWPLPDDDLEEGWTALSELKEQGATRLIGVSNFSAEQMTRCEKISPIDLSQPEYSLVDRSAEKGVFPYLEDNNIGAIVYSPLKHGILSGSITRERVARFTAGDWRKGHAQYTEPELSNNLEMVETLSSIAKQHNCSPAEVAVAWTLRRPTVTGAIIGGRRPDHFEQIVRSADLELNAEDLNLLRVTSAS